MQNEISIPEIMDGKPFIVEQLNTEGSEIMANAREKYKDLAATNPDAPKTTLLFVETVRAILLSSDDLLKKTGLDLPKFREYVNQIAEKAPRFKADKTSEIMELYRKANSDFLSESPTKGKPTTETHPQDTSSPQQQATPLNTPQG
jgi:5,10-methenyltetrahydromethanopterin hydrogenase